MPYGEGPPSTKAKMRVQEAHNYAASQLDPVIGEAVSRHMSKPRGLRGLEIA